MERGRAGYALYLLSCAVNLARQPAIPARLTIDGRAEAAAIHDAVVTNTALYAGEFRFDAGDHSDDGRLDVQVFTGAADYVRCFVAAWRRHLRAQRGELVQPLARLRRVERLDIEFTCPVRSQLDGEEGPVASRFVVRVLPRALRIHR
jgi:diacylglycerol kinase family enzyme